MAIGSEGEIGVTFLTGAEGIHYPWIVDGEQRQLMHGEAKLVYVLGRPDNIYPPDWDFVWAEYKPKKVVIEKPHDELGMGYLD